MMHHPENLLLSALSEENRQHILRRSVSVTLPDRISLYKPDQTPKYAYFMTSGIASVVTSTADGGTAEVGVIGHEGFTGAFHLLGPTHVPTDCFIQMEGTALRIGFADLASAFHSSPEIHSLILEFIQVQAVGLAQLAGCHRLHEAEERLARWLLMAQDRTQTDVLNLTQEFLAMMLGSRRTTVTMIAGAMQRSGLIEYHRGQVKIMNRENLEAAACDCYPLMKDLYAHVYTKNDGNQRSHREVDRRSGLGLAG
jgi:CRP-like cAMP-binding protein